MRAQVLAVASELARGELERSVDLVIGELPPALADPNLIRAVWQNLIGNAWKYTSRHESARIEVGASQRAEGTVYWVKDDGAGFDMAYVEKLFSAFHRLHRATEFPGTGIGLTTVRRIVLRHGGDVWGHGEVEKGATFYFTLEGGNALDARGILSGCAGEPPERAGAPEASKEGT
jgi:light-regulated signal transduction histidine kinase (bacteriophytochrome)